MIERPVEEVFDTVADARDEPLYNVRLISVETASAGSIGAGTRWYADIARGRRRIPMTIEITAFERPRRLASGTRLPGMDITGELSFEPVTVGTRMQWCCYSTVIASAAPSATLRRPQIRRASR